MILMWEMFGIHSLKTSITLINDSYMAFFTYIFMHIKDRTSSLNSIHVFFKFVQGYFLMVFMEDMRFLYVTCNFPFRSYRVLSSKS